MYIIYDFIFLIFAFIYLPYFLAKNKFHKDLWQRFGIFPKSINHKLSTINRPVWLHAVSVGEVAALKTFWTQLRREFPLDGIVVSTVTKTGNRLARRLATEEEIVFYLPLDISFIINALLKRFRPKVLVIAETEIWPNLIAACYRRGLPVILVNGRISDKAFRRYKLVSPLLRRILRRIDFICARTEEDRKRFIALGAPSVNVKVAGNMKYDVKGCVDLNKAGATLRLRFDLGGQEKIFTAGSTHQGEEGIILEVFKKLLPKFPNLHLIIAPRHVERAGEVRRLVNGFPVTVIDEVGILQETYSISDIVFVGGSLIPHGGHNIIEPAVFGKPIFFGPYMFNFKDEVNEFLKGNAAIMVRDSQGLETGCLRVLSDEREGIRLGENAKKVVSKNQGAVRNCIYELKRHLTNDPR